MDALDIPDKISVPFAESGTRNAIPVPSQVGIVDGKASFTTGFPPKTMQPPELGGVPPFGGDANGILFDVTAIQRWQSAGGLFRFDASFATAIGGYPKGCVLGNLDGNSVWVNVVDDNMSNPDAGGAGWYPLPVLLNVRRFVTTAVDGVTSNQAGLVAAVAAANALGLDLYWDAQYVSDANIPLLHTVRHFGPGSIKRGSAVFYVQPKGSQANTLNIATTGSATNDGLGTSQPMATFQNAFDALANYGPVLQGFWTIAAAAGTYNLGAGQQTLRTASINRVTIRGPAVGGHPNVPTCLIDGTGGGAFSHGLSAGTGTYAEFRDIKAVNFTGGGPTRIGFLCDVGSDVYANNCHNASGSTWAGLFASSATLRLSGGIWEGAQWGVGCYNSRFTIGYNGSVGSLRPIIQNNTQAGVSLQAISMGHLDWTDLTDNPTQLIMEGNSRVHIMGCNFVRGTIHIDAANGCTYYNDPAVGFTNNFNIGTADTATQATFVNNATSGETVEGGSAQSERRVAFDRLARTASGTTPAVLATPFTIPADRLRGVGKTCKVVVSGIYTVTALSTFTVKFGGLTLTLTVPAAATAAPFTLEATLYEAQGGYRAFGTLEHNLSAARKGSVTAGFVNNTAQAISVETTMAGAGDTVTIYRTDVFITG